MTLIKVRKIHCNCVKIGDFINLFADVGIKSMKVVDIE